MNGLFSILLGFVIANGPGLTRVSFNSAHPPTLMCSVYVGCEIILVPGEKLTFATVLDDRWATTIEDAGDDGDAPRFLLVPSVVVAPNLEGKDEALKTSVYIKTDHREYIVDLVASASREHHRLGFEADAPAMVVRPRAVVRPLPQVRTDAADVASQREPSSVSEVPPLDPSKMDFGWQQSKDAPTLLRCVGLFSIGEQLFCKLPYDALQTPSAFALDVGGPRRPLNTHMVGSRYVVIDGLPSPIELDLGGAHPQKTTIWRARE